MDMKTRRRADILDKAGIVFMDKGLMDTVMEDVAEAAGVTRRTLYRYFETKEDLAYEVTIGLLNEWNAYHRRMASQLSGLGIDQMKTFLHQLVDYMKSRVHVMKYLGDFDRYCSRTQGIRLSADRLLRFNDVILISDEILRSILHRGVEDGSIRQDVDETMMVATMSNVLWSFGQRVADRDEVIRQEYGIDGVALIEYQIDLYIEAMRSRT